MAVNYNAPVSHSTPINDPSTRAPSWSQYAGQGIRGYYDKKDQEQQDIINMLPQLAQVGMAVPGGNVGDPNVINVPGMGPWTMQAKGPNYNELLGQQEYQANQMTLGDRPMTAHQIKALADKESFDDHYAMLIQGGDIQGAEAYRQNKALQMQLVLERQQVLTFGQAQDAPYANLAYGPAGEQQPVPVQKKGKMLGPLTALGGVGVGLGAASRQIRRWDIPKEMAQAGMKLNKFSKKVLGAGDVKSITGKAIKPKDAEKYLKALQTKYGTSKFTNFIKAKVGTKGLGKIQAALKYGGVFWKHAWPYIVAGGLIYGGAKMSEGLSETGQERMKQVGQPRY